MRKLSLIILLAILIAGATACAATVYPLIVKVEIRNEPIKVNLPLEGGKAHLKTSSLKELFGKENPTLLDVVEKVLEVPEGRKGVLRLIELHKAAVFDAFAVGVGLSEEGYFFKVLARPLFKPEDAVSFTFSSCKGEGYSLEVEYPPKKFEWSYRNLTDAELKELVAEMPSIVKYENRAFVAAELKDYHEDHISLWGFAWEDKPFDLNGFKAYRGIEVFKVYEHGEVMMKYVKYEVILVTSS